MKRLYVLCVLGKIVSVRLRSERSPRRPVTRTESPSCVEARCSRRRNTAWNTAINTAEHASAVLQRAHTCHITPDSDDIAQHSSLIIALITGSRAPAVHILIVYTTYTAVNDTIAVDPSRIPASARAHRGSGARLHRSPPHTHTAADRVGHPSTLIELVAVACTPERQARTPRTGVPPAHRRAHQLPLVGRPIHAYDVIHSATA